MPPSGVRGQPEAVTANAMDGYNDGGAMQEQDYADEYDQQQGAGAGMLRPPGGAGGPASAGIAAHQPPPGRGWGVNAAGGDDYVTSFSDDDAEELEARMSRFSNTMNTRYETHSRSKSMMRYTELERERSRRRQKVVMKPGGMWGATLKLQMLNAGVVPLKKGKNDRVSQLAVGV